MNIALCDDSAQDLAALRAALEEYAGRGRGPELRVFYYLDGGALLGAAEGMDFELCLLDILMPGLSGIETARRLKQLQPGAAVIFLTNSAEFALDAFQVRAKNYLLKPVQPQRLFEALDELLRAPRPRPVELAVEGGGSLVVPVDKVVYLECADHRILYHLADGGAVAGRTLRVPFLEAAAPFRDSGLFLQPHRSYLVNARHILRLSDTAVTLTGGTELAVSQLRRRAFRAQYMDLLAGGLS